MSDSSIQVDVLSNFDDIIKKMVDLEKRGLKLDVSSDLVKQFTTASDVLKKRTSEALIAAADAGFGSKMMSKIDKIGSKFHTMMADAHKESLKIGDSLISAGEKLSKLNKDMQDESLSAADRMNKRNEIAATEAQQKTLRAQDVAAADRMRAIIKGQGMAFDLEMDTVEKVASRKKELLDEHMKDMKKGLAQRSGEFNKGLAGGLKDLQSGDFGSIFKNLGGYMEKKGAAMSQKGASKMAATGGKSGAGMAKMGAAMGKVGAALGPIGIALIGIVAIVGVIAAVINKAWKQQTDWNKKLLEGASAADVAALGYKDVGSALQDMHDIALDGMFALKMGLKPDDVIEIQKSFMSASLSVKDFTSRIQTGTTNVEKWQHAVKKAVDMGRLFGMGHTEIAENMSDYMHELGTSLEVISERFAMVGQVAQNAGFNTKRFYAMVTQATSGMTMYNVRLIESAMLLTKLGKILGKKMGGDMLKSLTDGFKSESFVDSYKGVLKMGRGTASKIMGREAKAQAMSFQRGLGGADRTALGGAMGVDMNVSQNNTSDQIGDAMVQKLSKLSMAEQTELLAETMRLDKSGDMTRTMQNMLDVMRGVNGSVEDLAIAQDALGPGGVLMRQLMAVKEIIPGKIHKMNFEELVALQGMEGYSREQIRQLQRISHQAEAQWNALEAQKGNTVAMHKELAEKLAANGGKSTEETTLLSQTLEDSLKSQVESFGGYIDANGNIMVAGLTANGEAVDRTNAQRATEAEHLIALQASYADNRGEAENAADVLSSQVARATMDLATITENVIAWILRQIMKGVNWIVSHMGNALDDDQREMQSTARVQIQSEIAALQSQMGDKSASIQEAERALRTSKPGAARDAAKQELRDAKFLQADLMGRIAAKESEMAAVMSINSTTDTRQELTSVEDFRKQGRGEKTEGVGLEGWEHVVAASAVVAGVGITLATGGAAAPAMLAYGGAAVGGGLVGGGLGSMASGGNKEDAAWATHMKQMYDRMSDDQKAITDTIAAGDAYQNEEGNWMVTAEDLQGAIQKGMDPNSPEYQQAQQRILSKADEEQLRRDAARDRLLEDLKSASDADRAQKSMTSLARASGMDELKAGSMLAGNRDHAKQIAAMFPSREAAAAAMRGVTGLDPEVRSAIMNKRNWMQDGILRWSATEGLSHVATISAHDGISVGPGGAEVGQGRNTGHPSDNARGGGKMVNMYATFHGATKENMIAALDSWNRSMNGVA